MQMANANVNPFTEAKLDPKNPDRGPLLIIDGEVDHTVPWAIANAAYKRQSKNEAPTEIKKIPNRGHSLTIDSGWREVAETALEFVRRFACRGQGAVDPSGGPRLGGRGRARDQPGYSIGSGAGWVRRMLPNGSRKPQSMP